MEEGPSEGARKDEAMEDFRREIQLVEARTELEAHQGETGEAARKGGEEEDHSQDKELEEEFVQQQLVDKVKELQERRKKAAKRKGDADRTIPAQKQERSNETSGEDASSEDEAHFLFDWRAKSLQ